MGKKGAKSNAEKNRNPKLMMIFTELELILQATVSDDREP